MIDASRHVARHGNQTALGVKDLQHAHDRRSACLIPTVRTERLPQLKGMPVTNAHLFTSSNNELGTFRQKGLQRKTPSLEFSLLDGFLEPLQSDGSLAAELSHRRAPEAGEMRRTTQPLTDVVS